MTTSQDISAAIQGFQNAIDQLFKRYERRRNSSSSSTHDDDETITITEDARRQARKLVKHTQHLLERLLAGRQSLQSLLEWFQQEWSRNLNSNHLVDHPSQVLRQFLQTFLRCQDGLVVLTSGECRHPGDTQEARRQTKFPSRLGSLEKRKDGYTSLYRSDAVYSGFGWDEFANETVGIQARLCHLLGRFYHKKKINQVWEYLVDHGAQLVESFLDQQETAVKDLQQQLQGMKSRLLEDIGQRLHPTKVTFLTQDKMERMLVVLPVGQKISLERRADTFQIQDSNGVLPKDHKTPKDWDHLRLKLPSSGSASAAVDPSSSSQLGKHTSRRRRRVIEDSDDSDNDDGERIQVLRKRPKQEKKNASASDGLMVKIETTKPKQEAEESLAVIKSQMGVDAQGLETAREELERETNDKNNAPATTATTEDNNEEQETIRKGERKVQRLKLILQRVRSRSKVDDNELWDARECLREAYMALGNDLMWLSSKTSEHCEEALDYFGNAGELVQDQQDAHRAISEQTNDNTLESRFVGRNLVLLQGQSSVNRGIALIEWSQLPESIGKPSAAKNKKLRTQAVKELSQAQRFATDLRRQARIDQQQTTSEGSKEWIDTVLEIFKADQLESLISRWIGVAYWHHQPSQQQKSVQAFDRAGSFFFSRPLNDMIRNHQELVFGLLEVGIECMHAGTTLADVACTAMERLTRAATETRMEQGNELLSLIQRSLERNAKISETFESLKSQAKMAQGIESFQQDNNMISSSDIRESLVEIQKWWSDIKSQPGGLGIESSSGSRTIGSDLPRGDLFSLGLTTQQQQPVNRRFIVQEGASNRRKRGDQSGTGTSHAWGSSNNGDAAIHALGDDEAAARTSRRPLQFRKWGDELLPQIILESGESKPKLVYPAVAPEMPPEMRAMIEGN